MQPLAFDFESPVQAELAPEQLGLEQPNFVSEIILANGASASLTFAMLAHLSHQYKSDLSQPESGRWLTWLCPQNIGKSALQQFHFDALGVRVLHPKNYDDIPSLMYKALAAGNSHTVVAHCEGIESDMAPWLEAAALEGNSKGLIIRPQ